MGYRVVRLRLIGRHGQAAAGLGERSRSSWPCHPASAKRYLEDEAGLPRSAMKKVAAALRSARSESSMLDALGGLARPVRGAEAALARPPASGRGQTRRTSGLAAGQGAAPTSSHYTPRSLTEPVVRKTLEPLLAAMKARNGGGEPTSKQILDLKVCDPAMGSGAFLVAACRYLADQVVAAWTREGQLDKVASASEEATVLARRLVAQRCLYGVDKNPFAVEPGQAFAVAGDAVARTSRSLSSITRSATATRSSASALAEIEAFDWSAPDKPAQIELFPFEVKTAIEEAAPPGSRSSIWPASTARM